MLSDNDLIQARHRLAAGRILATKQFPYYHTTMMSMVTVEMPGLGKFAVDRRWRLYFDPELCLRWSPEEIAAEWIHNVEHIIRKHEERFKSLEGSSHDPQVYNAAADAAINSDLKSQGINMPDPETRFYAEKNTVFPTWKKSMSAEEMYFSSRGASVFEDEFDENSGSPAGQNPDEDSASSDDTKDSSESTKDDSEKDENEETSSSENKDEKESGNDEENPSSEGDSKDSKEKSDSSPEAGEEESSGSPSDESGDSSDEDAPQTAGEASEEKPDGSGDDSEDDSGSPTSEDDSKNGESGKPSGSDASEDQDDQDDGDIQLHRDNSVESGDFQEIGDKQDPSKDDSPPGDSSDGEPSQDENGTPSPKHLPDCGSAAGGPPRDYERKDDEEDGSVDPATANSLLEKTAKEIQSYAARNPGKVPGGLLREAQNILEPQIDWMDEFLALFRSVVAKISGYSNYSYARPSRRSSGSDFIMPILRNPPAPETAIVLDTSGSMDESKEIAMALAEMEDILNRVARFSETQSVKVINCDAAATSVVALRDMNDFEIIGGGGTDMRVGIKAAAEIHPRMDIILVITDGGTPWPKEIPKENPYATYIVLLVGPKATRNKALPEWMNVIEVKIPQKRFGLKMR